MAYTPQTWVDNNASYPLSAARMNTMESGIAAAASVADQGHMILTTAQRDALGAVTAGTTIYNSTLTRVQTYYDGAWVDGDTFRTVGANKYNNVVVPPSASIRRTTDQTGYASGGQITWQSTQYDTDTMWSAGAPTRLTVNTAGIYLITFYVYLTATATLTYIQPDIIIDGNQFQTNFVPAISTTAAYAGVSATASLTAGQYIAAAVYLGSGSAHIIKGSASYGGSQTRLTATLIGRVS
jgi:hypothetical protein